MRINAHVFSVIADGLAARGMVKFGEFKLKLHEKNPDAPLSPIYIDLRLLRSFPEFMTVCVEALIGMASEISEYDLVADVPTAGTPIAAVFSHLTGKPMITPREPKTHGTGAKIDGVFKVGQRVLLIDDLITGADSKMKPIQILEEAGLTVVGVVVLVDRQQGGAKQLETAGHKLFAAFNIRELLEQLVNDDSIDRETYGRVMRYIFP